MYTTNESILREFNQKSVEPMASPELIKEVNRAMNNLVGTRSNLEDCVSELNNRLRPVLPANANKTIDKTAFAESVEYSCQLAQSLGDECSRLKAIYEMVVWLLNNMEI